MSSTAPSHNHATATPSNARLAQLLSDSYAEIDRLKAALATTATAPSSGATHPDIHLLHEQLQREKSVLLRENADLRDRLWRVESAWRGLSASFGERARDVEYALGGSAPSSGSFHAPPPPPPPGDTRKRPSTSDRETGRELKKQRREEDVDELILRSLPSSAPPPQQQQPPQSQPQPSRKLREQGNPYPAAAPSPSVSPYPYHQTMSPAQRHVAVGVTPSSSSSFTVASTAEPPQGYPAVNAAGQRTCRACGQPGRYNADGKCVEKWGPGPWGSGTVCDRCRKKMKRVERRGSTVSTTAIPTTTSTLTRPNPMPPPPPRAPHESSPSSRAQAAQPSSSPPREEHRDSEGEEDADAEADVDELEEQWVETQPAEHADGDDDLLDAVDASERQRH